MIALRTAKIACINWQLTIKNLTGFRLKEKTVLADG